jgi:predicted kinase
VERLQWAIAKRALNANLNVILEWGFWSKAERNSYRSQAKAIGAQVKLHYLHVEHEELWARLSKRNANLPPGTFIVTEEDLALWSSWFEEPDPDEYE